MVNDVLDLQIMALHQGLIRIHLQKFQVFQQMLFECLLILVLIKLLQSIAAILIHVLYVNYHLQFIFLNPKMLLYINQLQVCIQLDDLHTIYHLYCNTLTNKLNLMLRNCVRY